MAGDLLQAIGLVAVIRGVLALLLILILWCVLTRPRD
jgi:hypothetical protein